MENFNSILDKLNEDYQFALNSNTGEGYSRLSTIFEELGGYLREYIQDLTEIEVKAVMRKLQSGHELNEGDLALIRLWIVDDAERYLKLENNFDDWQEELQRIIGVLSSYKDKEANVTTAAELRAIFRDGSRVLSDIFYFMQQKDRVAKFEQASKALGPQERSLLIGLLEQKMKSSEF